MSRAKTTTDQIAAPSRQGDGTLVQTANSFTAGQLVAWDAAGKLVPSGQPSGQSPYDIVSSYVGNPGAGALIYALHVIRPLTLAANFAGSGGSVETAPTGSAVFTVKKSTSGTVTTLGTATIATSGTVSFATTGGAAIALAAGDRLLVYAPSPQDATLWNPALTFAAGR